MNHSVISTTVLASFVCFLVFFSVSGCTRYLEEETPLAQSLTRPMEPVSQSKVYVAGEIIAGTSYVPPQASLISPYIGRPLSGAALPMTQETYEASIARFYKSYTKANSPRIAVYLNRSLSDEVREWITPVKQVMTGRGEKVSVGQDSPTVITPEGTVVKSGGEAIVEGSTDVDRGLTTYTLSHIEEVARRNPKEIWMWRFEDNFLQPFLKSGAKIVDRSTILRLVGSTSEKENDLYALSSAKKIEMDALMNYADIYVEILVTRDHTSPSGYAFKATAKETKTGTIVGIVAKTGRDYRYEKSYEVFATSSGYDLRKSSPALILENVSQELAIDLMNSMANFLKE